MKKERKHPRITGATMVIDGQEIAIDPKKIPALAGKCAAIIKTLETGVQHVYIA